MEISTSSGTSTTSCTLLDQPVGFKCLASLLGVGGARLGKKAAGNPDLRFGKHGHHSKPGTWTVDGFLQVAYDAVAETLPDEFLRYPIVILLDYVQTILYHQQNWFQFLCPMGSPWNISNLCHRFFMMFSSILLTTNLIYSVDLSFQIQVRPKRESIT